MPTKRIISQPDPCGEWHVMPDAANSEDGMESGGSEQRLASVASALALGNTPSRSESAREGFPAGLDLESGTACSAPGGHLLEVFRIRTSNPKQIPPPGRRGTWGVRPWNERT